MVSKKKFVVGGETLAYCGKCRQDTPHVIVAMVDGLPVKVECVSCHAVHKYRPAAEDKARLTASGKRRKRSVSTSSTTKTATRRTVSKKKAAEAATEAARVEEWEAKVNGHPLSDFKTYSPKEHFEEGQLVRHPRFGDGYVVRIVDSSKMEVMFEHGQKTLVQGLGA